MNLLRVPLSEVVKFLQEKGCPISSDVDTIINAAIELGMFDSEASYQFDIYIDEDYKSN